MGDMKIKILCYPDDAVLIAESEDKLQKLLHQFNTTAKKFKMNISVTKTRATTRSKTPLRCKLEIDGKSVQQEIKFKYLGIEISGYGNIKTEVRGQAMKAARTAACLNNTIWSNKHMGIETKSRIYKAAIRPILTYTAETRPDRKRSEEIRRMCKIDNINDWVLQRKRNWNEHSRMTDDRIVKTLRDKSPAGQGSTERPRKRWSDNLSVN